MKKVVDAILICAVVTLTIIFFVHNSSPKKIDGGNAYGEYNVDELKKLAARSFDEAEIKVYNVKPVPDIVGPNEDPAKCICRGSGVIVHGDGHTTSCPYHGSKDGTVMIKPLIILEK